MFHTDAALPDPTGLVEVRGTHPGLLAYSTRLTAAKTDALRSLVAAWIKLKG